MCMPCRVWADVLLPQPFLSITVLEGVAWTFGEGSLFLPSGASGYILGPDEMGPDYSELCDDAGAGGTGPMTPEAFAAWLKAEGGTDELADAHDMEDAPAALSIPK